MQHAQETLFFSYCAYKNINPLSCAGRLPSGIARRDYKIFSLIRAFCELALKCGNENRISIGTFYIYDHIAENRFAVNWLNGIYMHLNMQST
jgi:hypothetical protein